MTLWLLEAGEAQYVYHAPIFFLGTLFPHLIAHYFRYKEKQTTSIVLTFSSTDE